MQSNDKIRQAKDECFGYLIALRGLTFSARSGEVQSLILGCATSSHYNFRSVVD